MYLVFSWNIGLAAICMTTWLSQNKVIRILLENPRSDRRSLSQINSQVVDVIAWYLASALECATICCFYYARKQNYHQ